VTLSLGLGRSGERRRRRRRRRRRERRGGGGLFQVFFLIRAARARKGVCVCASDPPLVGG